ncbi:MAG: putative toxin-antitoxin system toxin component, PIN family [Vicinamibacteria bacterium]|nr:putative toxin-antitoxin system toxin component, PIN family [Vicinamibacteria bacterium]
MRVVLDTNVLVAGLRSRNGASFQVLSMVGTGRFETVVSVPLVLEYEAALRRQVSEIGSTALEIDTVLDYICSVSSRREVYFLWRPVLSDPSDECVLEVAVEAECDAIVTHNVDDFVGVERFGLEALRPAEFLKRVRGQS